MDTPDTSYPQSVLGGLLAHEATDSAMRWLMPWKMQRETTVIDRSSCAVMSVKRRREEEVML